MKRNSTIRIALGTAFASALIAMPALADQPSPQAPAPDQAQPTEAAPPPAQGQPNPQMPAQGQAQPAPGAAVAEAITATATVQQVNVSKRQLLLKDQQGHEFTVTVPERVTRFENIQPGDRVSVDYYEAVALSLKTGKPQNAPGAKETTTVERAPGTLPSGTAMHTITASVQIVSIDRNDNTVTVERPDGTIDTVKVTRPAAQAELAKLRPGERIQATYTEAIAIHVTPRAKAPPAG